MFRAKTARTLPSSSSSSHARTKQVTRVCALTLHVITFTVHHIIIFYKAPARAEFVCELARVTLSFR